MAQGGRLILDLGGCKYTYIIHIIHHIVPPIMVCAIFLAKRLLEALGDCTAVTQRVWMVQHLPASGYF